MAIKFSIPVEMETDKIERLRQGFQNGFIELHKGPCKALEAKMEG